MTLFLPAKNKNKYRAKGVMVDGVYFHSTGEANRWQELQLLERNKDITELKRQVKFILEVNGYIVTTTKVDFTYREKGFLIIEDYKGFITEDAKLRLLLLYAIYVYNPLLETNLVKLRISTKKGVFNVGEDGYEL